MILFAFQALAEYAGGLANGSGSASSAAVRTQLANLQNMDAQTLLIGGGVVVTAYLLWGLFFK